MVAQILLNDGHKSELGHHESNAQPCMIFTTLCLVVGYFRLYFRGPTFPGAQRITLISDITHQVSADSQECQETAHAKSYGVDTSTK